MKSYFLCMCAVLSVPQVTSIRCYVCMPGHKNLCQSVNKSAIDCDNDPEAPTKYDACAKTAFEIDHEGQKEGMYYLTCAVKSICDNVKKWSCNKTALKSHGIIVRKCDHSCCSYDRCNAPDLAYPGNIHLTSLAVNPTVNNATSTTPTSVSSKAAPLQLITTFMNVSAIFAPIYYYYYYLFISIV